jgi:hypothetical protein
MISRQTHIDIYVHIYLAHRYVHIDTYVHIYTLIWPILPGSGSLEPRCCDVLSCGVPPQIYGPVVVPEPYIYIYTYIQGPHNYYSAIVEVSDFIAQYCEDSKARGLGWL